MTIETSALKQPQVFKLAYCTTICERFGFYVLSFLLVLFAKSQYALTDIQAVMLVGVFTALAYLTPAIGGYLGDNVFGIRRCMIGGLFLEGTGLLLLAIPNTVIFALALSLIAIGTGFFKTAPTDLLAHSYNSPNDPRIDPGFTLYYMAINIGSLIASIIAGSLQEHFGWHIAFVTGGVGVYLGLIFYYFFRKTAIHLDTRMGAHNLSTKKIVRGIIGIILCSGFFMFLLAHANIANIFFGIATTLTFVYFLYEIIKSPKDEKLKIIACLYLILVGLACAVLYFQLFTSVELFIERSVVRNVLGHTIPTTIYLGLNPIFVILLGPILAAIYTALNKRKCDLSVAAKLTWGLLATALCFFCLVIGGKYFATSAGQVSSWWVVAMFLLFTVGDLMNSALGVAMVTHIAPRRLYGVMMGTWFLVGNSLAASLSGIFASTAAIPEGMTNPHAILNIYNTAFLKLGIAGVIISVIIFMLNPYIKKITNLK